MRRTLAAAAFVLLLASSANASVSLDKNPLSSVRGVPPVPGTRTQTAPVASTPGLPPNLSNVFVGKPALGTPAPIESPASTTGGGESFATATVIPSLPYLDGGSTVGFFNDYNPVCAGGGAPDVVYRYSPAVNTCVTISLCGSGFDTVLHLYKDSLAGLVACNDDYCGAVPQQSKLLSVALEAGHDYYIVVDGYGCDINGCSQGPYGVAPPGQLHLAKMFCDWSQRPASVVEGSQPESDAPDEAQLQVLDPRGQSARGAGAAHRCRIVGTSRSSPGVGGPGPLARPGYIRRELHQGLTGQPSRAMLPRASDGDSPVAWRYPLARHCTGRAVPCPHGSGRDVSWTWSLPR